MARGGRLNYIYHTNTYTIIISVINSIFAKYWEHEILLLPETKLCPPTYFECLQMDQFVYLPTKSCSLRSENDFQTAS